MQPNYLAFTLVLINVMLLCYICYRIHNISNNSNKKLYQLLEDNDFIKILYFLGVLIIILGIRILFFNKNVNDENIAQTLFSVQATVSTLGIALLSILGGVCKDSVYGISISKFITQIRPTILKHKRLVITELVLIILGYFALSLSLYNTLIAIFISSIAIVGCMVNDIFGIFKGNMDIENKIKRYYLSLFSHYSNDEKIINKKLDVIISLNKDIISKNNKYVNIEDHLKFTLQLFIEIIKNLNITNEDKLLKTFQTNLRNTLNNVLKNIDSDSLITTIDFLTTIHKVCNERNTLEDDYIYLNIYDYIEKELWICVRKYLSTDFDELFNKLQLFKFALYHNMYFDKEDNLKNNKCVSGFSFKFYKLIKVVKIFENSSLSEFKFRLYTYSKGLSGDNSFAVCLLSEKEKQRNKSLKDDYINFKTFMKRKQNMVLEEVENYTKILVDNIENQILKRTFFFDIKNPKANSNQYYFNILVYIYYLAEFEYMVGENEKIKYKDMLESNRGCIKNYLNQVHKLINNGQISIKKLEDNYKKYEKMDSIKLIQFPTAVVIFTIYCIIYLCNNSTEEVHASIILQGNGMWFYTRYNEHNHCKIISKYKSFVKLFFEEKITDDEAKEKIELFHQVCEILQKKNIMDTSEKLKLDSKELKLFELDANNIVNDEFSNVISLFNNNTEKIETISLKRTINTEAITFKIHNWFNTYLLPYFKEKFYEDIVDKIIKLKLKQENIIYKNEQMYRDFVDKGSSLNIDTILGGNIIPQPYFEEYKHTDECIKFIESKLKVTKDGLYNNTIALDSSQCYFKINNVDVKINHCDKSEYTPTLGKEIEKFFSPAELDEYYSNTKYQITIDIKLEYGFANDNFGVALFANETEKVLE